MPDTTRYDPEVRAAIELVGLEKNAWHRAWCGANWLDRHAPRHWRLNMMSITGGRVHSYVRIAYDDQNPLALAFRDEEEMKRDDGRVSAVIVAASFSALRGDGSQAAHGFDSQSHRVDGKVLIDRAVDGEFLDQAWAKVLGELDWHFQPGPAQVRAA